jgi:methylmalonyl-CoA mutase N-terminal domain/subunit
MFRVTTRFQSAAITFARLAPRLCRNWLSRSATGIEYVDWGIRAGLDVERFVPRISFFFNAHNDFFEEVAKYRAARRIWARVMRDRFGAVSERTMQLRFHTQTAGVS